VADHTLRPEETAYLMGLATRLGSCGYTHTTSGVGTDGEGKPYVFVAGRLRGEPMECSFSLDLGTAIALRSLGAVVDRVAMARRGAPS
jgi:hypothetical protein